jgi:hypothetical protein
MDPSQPAGSRRRTTAIIAAAGLACLAIAVPVSGAFGAGDSGPAAQSQGQGGQGYGQQGYGQPPGPNGQNRPPGGQGMPNGKCPKHRGTGSSQGSGSSDSSGTALPGDSVAS